MTLPQQPYQIISSPRLGLTYVTVGGGGFFFPYVGIIDTQSGRLVRLVHTRGAASTIEVDDALGHLLVSEESISGGYATGNYSGVAMYDARTGGLLSFAPMPHPTINDDRGETAVNVQSHRLYVIQDKQIYSFDNDLDIFSTITGRLIRTIHVPVDSDLQVDAAANHLLLIVGRTLRRYDTTTGRLVDILHMGSPVLGLGIDDRHGHLYVGLSNLIVVIDNLSGAVVGHIHGPSRYLAVVGGGSRIFSLAIDTDSVNVYDTATGRLITHEQVIGYNGSPAPLGYDVILPQARLVVLDSTGQPDIHGLIALGPAHLEVLDAMTGHVLSVIPRTYASGVPSRILAVDPQRGRAFLANANGTLRVSNISCVSRAAYL